MDFPALGWTGHQTCYSLATSQGFAVLTTNERKCITALPLVVLHHVSARRPSGDPFPAGSSGEPDHSAVPGPFRPRALLASRRLDAVRDALGGDVPVRATPLVFVGRAGHDLVRLPPVQVRVPVDHQFGVRRLEIVEPLQDAAASAVGTGASAGTRLDSHWERMSLFAPPHDVQP